MMMETKGFIRRLWIPKPDRVVQSIFPGHPDKEVTAVDRRIQLRKAAEDRTPGPGGLRRVLVSREASWSAAWPVRLGPSAAFATDVLRVRCDKEGRTLSIAV